MLRLKPSEIMLTQGDVIGLKQRLDMRRMMTAVADAKAKAESRAMTRARRRVFGETTLTSGRSADEYSQARNLYYGRSMESEAGSSRSSNIIRAGPYSRMPYGPASDLLDSLPTNDEQLEQLRGYCEMGQQQSKLTDSATDELDHVEYIIQEGRSPQQRCRHSRFVHWSLRLDGTSASPPRASREIRDHERQIPLQPQRFRPRSSSDPGQHELPLYLARRRQAHPVEAWSDDDLAGSFHRASGRLPSTSGMDNNVVSREDLIWFRWMRDGATPSIRETAGSGFVPQLRMGPLRIEDIDPALIAAMEASTLIPRPRWHVEMPLRGSPSSLRHSLRSGASESVANESPSATSNETISSEVAAPVDEGMDHVGAEEQTVIIRPSALQNYRIGVDRYRPSRSTLTSSASEAYSSHSTVSDHSATDIPRRRRLNTEQENENNWDDLEEERTLLLERQRAHPGTPPGSRWYERYLGE